MIAVHIAWLVLALAFLGLFARDRITDLADRRTRAGRSWEQRPERQISGRF